MRLRIAENVYLESRDLISHIHGMGLSRTGKSKLIEMIVRDFIIKEVPFCLIDPHGTLYNAILDWLVVMEFEQQITLFDPSRGTVGFNPFKSDHETEAQIMTKAERLVSATFIAWKIADTSSTPRLTKMLTCLYYVMVEQQLPVNVFDAFLNYDKDRERAAILSRTKSEWVRFELGKLCEKNRTAYEAYIDSVDNKLRMFVHPQVRKVLSIEPLDLEAITRGGMLLVNLQAATDNTIGAESNGVLGTLLVNEFWEITYKRQKPREFFLIIDECHRYMTPDIAAMLAEGAKYGLHLMLFHQDRSQVRAFEGALKNAQTKIFFSTEEDPLPQRTFTLRRADHTRLRAQTLPVKTFHVSQEEREALIAKLAPTPPPVCIESEHEPQESPRTQIFSNAPEEISDDDLFE
jgi:type IV secretory pathway TraG/TraD family ATPase VirD4